MKKKIIMALLVMATVVGMGFAGTKTIKYKCGHTDEKPIKGKDCSEKINSTCPKCQKKMCDALWGSNIEGAQDVYDKNCK